MTWMKRIIRKYNIKYERVIIIQNGFTIDFVEKNNNDNDKFEQ